VTGVVVAGIDLSLTSTGIALAYWGMPHVQGATGLETEGVDVHRVTSTGRAGASLDQRADRLEKLAREITEHVCSADLVVIEGPSFGQARQGGQHDRSGLWWLIIDRAREAYGSQFVEVPPATRAKYATGKGNAPKDQVLAAVVKRYPDVDVTGNDVADALVLAAMGARHLGHPIEASLPQLHLDAMTKIRWPERNPVQ